MKVSLIGFMGSGKSTIAQGLANLTKYSVIEMDARILSDTGYQNMSALFQDKGEIFLREQEITCASGYRSAEDSIISCGGGVVLNKICIDYLKMNRGIVIFLDSSFEEIQRRIKNDPTPRPLFENSESAKKLYEFRLPLYRAYSDYQIQTEGKSSEEIAQEIYTLLKII